MTLKTNGVDLQTRRYSLQPFTHPTIYVSMQTIGVVQEMMRRAVNQQPADAVQPAEAVQPINNAHNSAAICGLTDPSSWSTICNVLTESVVARKRLKIRRNLFAVCTNTIVGWLPYLQGSVA